MDAAIDVSTLKITNEILRLIADVDEFKGAWPGPALKRVPAIIPGVQAARIRTMPHCPDHRREMNSWLGIFFDIRTSSDPCLDA